MARYIDKDHWEEEIVIPDTSTPVLGGQPSWEGGRMLGGFSNIPPAILADRTRYIRNRLEELKGDVERGLANTLKKSDNLSDLDDIQQAKYNLELNFVDNTSDVDKPISYAAQEALNLKLDANANAVSASKLATPRTISLSGDASGSTSFDGSANATIEVEVADDSHNHIISNVDGLQAELDSKVDKQSGFGLSQENYTPAEKSKLSSIEGSKFKGEYISLAALEAAQPSPEVGSYAYVDIGVGEVVTKYIWDSSDAEWVEQRGEAASLTPADVKSLYEENPDTNAFTDSEKIKLAGVQASATANATNAQLRDRATHTGVQPISSVSGLQAELDTRVDAAYVDTQIGNIGAILDAINGEVV